MVAPIEPRGVLAEYDPAADRYTLRIGTQGAFGMRGTLAQHLGVKEDKVRVVTGDVGGSFGMKSFAFPENALVPWAAKQLGRPVKWLSDRQEVFVTDTQGREQKVHAELALDEDGQFPRRAPDTYANIGAYLSYFSLFVPTMAGFRLLTGAYRIPAAHVQCAHGLHQHGLRSMPIAAPAGRNAPTSSSGWSIAAARETRAWPRRDPSPQSGAANPRCRGRRRYSSRIDSGDFRQPRRSARRRRFAGFERDAKRRAHMASS